MDLWQCVLRRLVLLEHLAMLINRRRFDDKSQSDSLSSGSTSELLRARNISIFYLIVVPKYLNRNYRALLSILLFDQLGNSAANLSSLY